MALLDLIADERRRVADLLEHLDADQWEVPSLCGAWTVRGVAAHLTAGWNLTRPGFAIRMLRNRGSFDRANAELANELAERPTDVIVEDLRSHARDPFSPPVLGHRGMLTDVLTHGQDIARPLGIEWPVDPVRARTALDLTVSPRCAPVVPRRLWKGLRFETDDQDWVWGDGPVVRGDSGSVLLALQGRDPVEDGLVGPGADELRRRRRGRSG